MSLTILDFEEGAVDVGLTTISVGAATTEGRLLVGGISIDKDSGSVPSPSSGWTLLGGDHSSSVSCALAARIADGSGTGGDDHLTWTWDDAEEPTAWIGEFDNWEDLGSLDDLLIQVSEHFTDENAVTEIDLGPVVAGGDGAAITQLAIDSAENWSGDSYTNGFAEMLDAGFAAGVEVRYLSGVAASASVETTSTTTGAGDQVSGMLVVISQPAPVTAWCGAVTTDGATVVAKVPAVGDDARLVVSTESDLSTPVYSDPVTVDELGLARLTIDELAADTGYYYGLEVDSVLLDDGRGEFTTMPSGAASFSFAHGSCWNPGAGATPTWDRIAASGARFMVQLGDFGYPDEFDGLSVNGLRNNYTKIGTDPDLAPLMAAMPWAYTWCDHDSGGDGAWSGSTDLPNAQQVYRERVAHYPLDDEDGIYQTFVCGRARFVLLDTRSFRDQHTDTDDANKTMLGAAQLAWLESVLEADNSRVIFLISSVPWNDPTTGSGDGDGWGRYNTERTALISMFTSLGVLDRLYIVCGDAHMVAADDGTNSPGGIPTVQAAPLGHEPSIKGGTFSEGSEAGSTQYGVITVTDPGGSGDVTVDFAGYDDDGEIAVSMETVFQAPPPVQRVNTSRAAADESTSASATRPSGTATGDLLLMALGVEVGTPKPQAPAGWEELLYEPMASGHVGAWQTIVWWRIDDGTAGPYSLTWGGSEVFNWWRVISYRAADGPISIDAADSQGSGGTSTSIVAPSIDVTAEGGLLAFLGVPDGPTTATWTPPSGMDAADDIANGVFYAEEQLGESTGATGTRTGTVSNARWNVGALIAIAPVAPDVEIEPPAAALAPPRPSQTPGVTTIRLQALDGFWETVGADRLRGVRHEALNMTANRSGADTARFTLRRPPGGVFPDLTAFTPCEIVNPRGVVVWEGFVWETPGGHGDDFSISVEGRGWQYHADDDVFQRVYVHTRLSDYKDVRSLLTTNLASHPAAGQVANDRGIVLTFPNGVALAAGRGVGVTLDLGPDSTARRVVAEVEGSNNSSITSVYIIGHDSEAWTADANPAREDYVSAVTLNTIGASDTLAGTSTNGHRYITLLLWQASSGTPSADLWVRFRSVKVFRDPAYESGGQSILKASDIVKDALPFAPLLSQDTSRIQASDFDIPDFAMADLRTPRQAWEAANALHNYLLKVGQGRMLEFRPQPDKPLFRIGSWGNASFKDASKNAGEEIYNRAIINGTGPDGSPVTVERHASQHPDVAFEHVSDPAFSNPSFDTDTSGWSAATGSVSRTTTGGSFTSAPAGLSWTLGNFDLLTGIALGEFEAGVTYVVEFDLRVPSLFGPFGYAPVRFGTADDYSVGMALISGTFTRAQVVWRPRATHSGASLRFSWPHSGFSLTVQLDTVTLGVARPTLADRRRFTRTHITSMSSAITDDVGIQIADVFLATHLRTPLKGDFAAAPGIVRRLLTDATVHPSELLLHTGELVHLSDQVDPDTGALGRDAPIDSVAYNDDDESAAVALDTRRDNLAALISRYDSVVGGGS